MTQLTVVAKIKAKATSGDYIHRQLQQLVRLTLAEKGCINYDLYCSIEDPSVFLMYENWVSKKLWEKHMQSDHIKAFQNNNENAIKAFEVFLLIPFESEKSGRNT
ncbi:putative quinol monooxygenase [Myxosarcina sp. GI1(2024)]